MDNTYLLARYAELCAAADRHANEGWRSLSEDGAKRQYAITPEVLDRFADYLLGGIGFEYAQDFFDVTPPLDGTVVRRPPGTSEQRARHIENIKLNLRRTEASFEEAGLDTEARRLLLRADGVVGGLLVKVPLYGKETLITNHTVRVASRAVRLATAFGGIPPSVLEIGGGHGRFVRDVLMFSPNTRITYCDLPFNMLMAARYLSRVFPGQVHLAWNHASVPTDARIAIVPPWRLAEIDYPIDVCCNFLSFQHMQADNLTYYGRTLKNLSVPAIFHINRASAFHSHEVTLDAYPFRSTYKSAKRSVVDHSITVKFLDGRPTEPAVIDMIEELLLR